MFGVFKLYQTEDCSIWFNRIRVHVSNNYIRPNEIIEYFHLFLDKELLSWFFKLNSNIKDDLNKFEISFYDEVYRLQDEYETLVSAKQDIFMKLFDAKHKDNKEYVAEVQASPLSSYIKLKLLTIKKVYSNILKEDAIRMTIFSLNDSDLKMKLLKFIKSDLVDILSLANSLDLYK